MSGILQYCPQHIEHANLFSRHVPLFDGQLQHSIDTLRFLRAGHMKRKPYNPITQTEQWVFELNSRGRNVSHYKQYTAAATSTTDVFVVEVFPFPR